MSDGARRVLVTGASAGIGRACAEELHAAGWAVTGASRRGTSSGGWTGLVMDVDDDDSVGTGVAGMLAAVSRSSRLPSCTRDDVAEHPLACELRAGAGLRRRRSALAG